MNNSIRKGLHLNDPTNGGVPLQRVPVIPWEAFVACGMKVFADGEIKVAVFTPQQMGTADAAFQTLRLLIAAQGQKPGPIQWDTVPAEVRRHFTFQSQ